MTSNGQFTSDFKGYLQAFDYLRANRIEPRSTSHEDVVLQANEHRGLQPLRIIEEPKSADDIKPARPVIVKKAKAKK